MLITNRCYLLGVLPAILLVSACAQTDASKTFSRSGGSAVGFAARDCLPVPDTYPVVVAGRNPIYPAKRLLKEEEGFVEFTFDITVEGDTEKFELVDSTSVCTAQYLFQLGI